MTSRLLILPVVLAVSACAQSGLTANLNKDCDPRLAAAALLPNHVILNSYGASSIGVVRINDPYAGRFSLKTGDCARAAPAQPPSPHSYDLDKVGGEPQSGAPTMVSDGAKPCPRSRA